jgi:hypothetical protein
MYMPMTQVALCANDELFSPSRSTGKERDWQRHSVSRVTAYPEITIQ